MTFVWPVALLALLLIPLAVIGYMAAQQRRARFALHFTNLDLLANIVDETPGWRRHVPTALYLAGLAALIIALARPEVVVSVPREEATVILVTDISGSMNAEDVEPTRLVAAQEAANVLIEELPEGFRVSLVTFSTAVQTRVMPTTDREAVRAALEALQANGGTAMGDALMHSLDLAQLEQQARNGDPGTTPTPTPQQAPGDEAPVVVVLLSDGYNTAGSADPLQAADRAAEFGLPVFTVALGTQDGIVQVPDSAGNLRTVRVPPDEETLEEIAERTGARFFTAPDASELRGIYEALGSTIGYDEEDREITPAFVAAAIFAITAGGALSLLWFNRFP
ncbi:MAG: VWA domain-containing protein [Dehalococcoidia bacterium]|nr:VWA domain-containing protein [Dehalococcoidia bacterium]